MAEITVTTSEAIAYLTSRAAMARAGRELPFRAGYVFAKLDRKIADELTEYDKARLALCEKHALRDENGACVKENEQFKFSPEGLDAFSTELSGALEEPLTLSNVRKVKLSEIATMTLSGAEQVGLLPFLEDDEG
jgi:hypothetical protein